MPTTPPSAAAVHLDIQNTSGPVDRRIFGGFLEHLGRAVYQGVYDPGNARSNEQGFRRDVLEALRPLGFSVMRYPGGNFVSAYDWTDGIGPRDKRPRRPDFAWRSIETNHFGADEFVNWCRQLGTDPLMAVNLGTAGAPQAAQLLEYCNLAAGTYWSDRRRENGHPDPYGIKLWCLGNEMDGRWQAGHVPAEVYAQRAFAASVLMKGIDRSIQTIACGSSGIFMNTYLDWDRKILEYCWETVDFISAHRYSNNDRNDSAWFLAEGVEIDRILQDYSGVIDYVRGVRKSAKRVYLSFDEWNVWYKNRAGDGQWQEAPHLLEEVYNFEDALVCAQYLSAFVRRADLVKIACIAQVVNVIAPILTRPDGVLVQSIAYPIAMFSKYAAGQMSLTPIISSPTYQAGERGEVPALDVSAVYDPQSQIATIFLVNRSSSSAMVVDANVADRQFIKALDAEVLGGFHLKTGNSWEHPNAVGMRKAEVSIVEGRLRATVPSPGFLMARGQLARPRS
jgi:alpha-N-arabinofuranosidase